MKRFEFEVPLYKYKIIVILMKSIKDKDLVLKEAKKLNLNEDHLAELVKMLEQDSYDGANIYYHRGKLKIFIVMFPHSSVESLLGTIIHEGRHATDEVVEACNIEGREAPAYLNEDICVKIIKEFIKIKEKG